ncbi:MAG: hypothetical protein HZA90_18660 [Verrucomicrobia bacterium]|nr:hypothetical protein [Verrucomicrobiota bacterium]
MNRTTALLAVAAFAIGAGAAQAQTVAQQWDFRTGDNLVVADGAAASAGAQARIAPGRFASPWRANSTALGAAEGVWDLGQRGVITLRTPARAGAASGTARRLTVRVVQYQDGGIYDRLATVSVSGATRLSTRTSQASTTTLGEWIVSETEWQVAAGATADAVEITGAEDGSLVDQVSIEMSGSAVVTGPQLAIRAASADGSRVEISWPASAGDVVLESSPSLSGDSVEWSPVTEPVQVQGETQSVTVDASGGSRFYRLKLP